MPEHVKVHPGDMVSFRNGWRGQVTKVSGSSWGCDAIDLHTSRETLILQTPPDMAQVTPAEEANQAEQGEYHV
jgi:hypothetical protein